MKKEIVSQYHAALKMLLHVIEKCPDASWNDDKYENAFWRLVYHALYYTDLYLAKNPESFNPWEKYIENYHYLGKVTRDKKPLILKEIYSKSEMLDYTEAIYNKCKKSVQDTDLEGPSGFPWLSMNKLELQLYNIRHLQHHIGQLIERLHQEDIRGIKWESQGTV